MKLPQDIDYSLYQSDSGMATKQWGPHAWDFLFTSIMGRYPVKTKRNSQIALVYKTFLTNLSEVMPCIFCRRSFSQFLKKLPIEPFLIGRIELMYWLYQMKDLVNQKLIRQEKKCYRDEKRRLKALYYDHKITKSEYYSSVEDFKKKTFVTIPTPPFKIVLDKYEAIRAVCSKKSLTCVLPEKK